MSPMPACDARIDTRRFQAFDAQNANWVVTVGTAVSIPASCDAKISPPRHTDSVRTNRDAWISGVVLAVLCSIGASLLVVWLLSTWLDLRFNPSVVAAVSASASAAAIAASERRRRVNDNS